MNASDSDAEANGAEKAATIHDALAKVITTVSDSAKKAQIISINASILANGNHSHQTLAGFQVVAEEIRTLSTHSLENIGVLENLLSQLRSVSATINKAGRQRMLAQKVLKLHLAMLHAGSDELNFDQEYRSTVQLFETSLSELQALPLNSSELSLQLRRVDQAWRTFTQSLRISDLAEWTQTNDLVVSEMNQAVQLYEDLIG